MDIEARMREVEREIISRRPEHSVDLALDRMTELVGLLGDPQRACPVIHITGTNGKTSTARMTDALLRARGLRTGRFTSPHLVSIRERIVVDGAPVSAERRRMEKDLAAARAEADQAERKLANADFTAKAPPAIVDKTRQRLDTAQADIARLEQRLAVLARGGDPPEPPGALRAPLRSSP